MRHLSQESEEVFEEKELSGPVRDTPPYRAIPSRDSIAEGGIAPLCEEQAHKFFTHKHFLSPFVPGLFQGQTRRVPPGDKLGFHCVR